MSPASQKEDQQPHAAVPPPGGRVTGGGRERVRAHMIFVSLFLCSLLQSCFDSLLQFERKASLTPKFQPTHHHSLHHLLLVWVTLTPCLLCEQLQKWQTVTSHLCSLPNLHGCRDIGDKRGQCGCVLGVRLQQMVPPSSPNYLQIRLL